MDSNHKLVSPRNIYGDLKSPSVVPYAERPSPMINDIRRKE